MTVQRATIVAQLLLISTCAIGFVKPQQSGSEEESARGEADISPYLLAASGVTISRVNPWPFSSGPQTPTILVRDDFTFGIGALDYHYRLGKMYWTAPDDGEIKSANLDGSDIRVLAFGGFSSRPAGITVDWVNDKLYWTYRNRGEIIEYDLKTEFLRIAYSTETGSLPSGIVVYPFPDYGWLYWTDSKKQTIERVSVTGDDHRVIRRNLGERCTGPIALDYLSQTIYWTDNCDYVIRSITILESRVITNELINRPVGSALGLTLYKDLVYWSESRNVFGFNVTIGGSPQSVVGGSSRGSFYGLKIVQPLNQPEAREYVVMLLNTTMVEMPVCADGCVNGQCVPPGLCACNKGWVGTNCTTDDDECERLDNGCEDLCVNIPGSYYCSCMGRLGYVLDESGRLCEDVDECELFGGGCEQNCTNLPGSFSCSCFEGYGLSSNGINCTRTPTIVMLLPSSTAVPVLPHTTSLTSAHTTSLTSAHTTKSTPIMLSYHSPAVAMSSSVGLVSTITSSSPIPIISTSFVPDSDVIQSTAEVSDSVQTSFAPHVSSTPVQITTSSISMSSTSILVSIPDSSSPIPIPTTSIPILMTSVESSVDPLIPTSTPIYQKSSSQVQNILTSFPGPSATPTSSGVQGMYTASTGAPEVEGPSTVQQLSVTPSLPPPKPPTTDETEEFPEVGVSLAVVISSGVAGGAAVFVVIIIVVVAAFGCYLKKTRTGSYDLKPVEPASLETGAIKTCNIVFHPSSLDSKPFGSIGKSHSSNGTLNGTGVLNGNSEIATFSRTNGHTTSAINDGTEKSDILDIFTS